MVGAACAAVGSRHASTRTPRISALTDRAARLEAEERHRLIEVPDQSSELRLARLIARPARHGRPAIDQRMYPGQGARKLLHDVVQGLPHLPELLLPLQLAAQP